jgi:multidrug transporter EmrE-like cation transporter
VFSFFIFGEKLSLINIGGIAVVLLGLILSQLATKQLNQVE